MHKLSKRDLIGIIHKLENELNIYKYDKLTGLLSRHDFENKLNKVLNKKNYWIRLIDINGLHKRNNEFGYESGDELIITVVNYLKETTNEIIYRTGGDEFCIIYNTEDYPDDINNEYIVSSTLNLYNYTNIKSVIKDLSKDLKIKKTEWYKKRNLIRR